MQLRTKAVVSIAMIALLGIYPLIEQRDSYPHSDLPMFASTRARVSRFTTAVAVDPAGNIIRLDPKTIARTDEVIAAQAALVRAVNRGQANELCREIAKRLKVGVAVRIQTETHDILASLEEPEALDILVHAECAVSEGVDGQ